MLQFLGQNWAYLAILFRGFFFFLNKNKNKKVFGFDIR